MTKRERGRIWLWLALSTGAALALLGLLVLAGIWRLQQGPISLDIFTGRVQKALNEKASPWRVELGAATLIWHGRNQPLELRTRNLRVFKGDGGELLSGAEIGVGLALRPLREGRLEPIWVEAVGTRIRVVRRQDGSLDLGIEQTTRDTRGEESSIDPLEMIHSWENPAASDAPLASLEEIRLRDARVLIDDRFLGFVWGTEEVDVVLHRGDEVLQMLIPLMIEAGGRRFDLPVDLRYHPAQGELIVRVEATDFEPMVLLRTRSGWEDFGPSEMPVSGWGEVWLRELETPRMERAELELTTDIGSVRGRVDFSAEKPWTLTGELSLRGIRPWRLAEWAPELQPLDGVRLPLDGRLKLELEDGELAAAALTVKAESGEILLPRLYPDPLILRGAEVRAAAQDRLESVQVERAWLGLGDLDLELEAEAQRSGDVYRGSLVARIRELPLADLKRYWPPGVEEDVREWIDESILGGVLRDLNVRMSAALPTGTTMELDVRSLDGSFIFSELELDVLSPQPSLVGIEGQATMAMQGLAFRLDRARMADLEVERGNVAIVGLDKDVTSVVLDAQISGPLETALRVVTEEPVAALPPDLIEGISGQIQTRLNLEVPLTSEGGDDEVGYAAQAQIEELLWVGGPLGLDIADGSLALNIRPELLEVRGRARVAGAPAELEYEENLAGEDPIRRVHVRAVVDEEALDAFGLQDQPYFSGAVEVDATYVELGSGTAELRVEADLVGAELEIPELGWSKPPGVAGTAILVAEIGERGDWTVEKLYIEAPDLELSARAQLTGEPLALRTLEVERWVLGNSELQVQVAETAAGRFSIRAAGPRLDLEPLIDSFYSAQEPDASGDGESPRRPPLELDLRFEELILDAETRFLGLSVQGSWDGTHWSSMVARARIEPDSQILFEYGPRAEEYALRLEASNIGQALSAFLQYGSLHGGDLEITGVRPSVNEPVTGAFALRDFTLAEAVILSRILRLGSLDGLSQAFQEGGFRFKILDGEFSYDPYRLHILTLRGQGRGFGLSVKGWVDFEEKWLDIDGVLAPIGPLVRTVAHIPLIGKLVTGTKKEGVLAADFSLDGSLGEPKVEARKLTALTPGITRDLFRLLPSKKKRRREADS